MRPDTSQEDRRPAKTWERRHTAGLGEAVKRQRGQLPAAWLERRTTQLGLKMTRQSIADLESGRRRFVTTSELLVLAAALNTTPVALMYPSVSDGPDNAVEVLPGVESTGFQAAQWFSGLRIGFIDDAVEADRDAEESCRRRAALQAELLRGWRQLDDLHRRRDQLSAPKGGRLTPEEVELLDFYNAEIENLRRLLQMLDGKSTGPSQHA